MNDPVNLVDEWGLSNTFEKISIIVQVADLIPVNSIPHPVTIAIGMILDFSAATFAAVDILRADLKPCEQAQAWITWGVSQGVSLISYIPFAGAVPGTIAETILLMTQNAILTGSPNPFKGW